MPLDIVRVIPGDEPAKVIVVPNSPRLRAQARTAPVKMEGAMVGSVIFCHTAHRDIPTRRAEVDTSWSMWRNAESTATTTKGSATKVCAVTTPAKAKANFKWRASRSGAKSPRRPSAALSARPPTTGGMASGR